MKHIKFRVALPRPCRDCGALTRGMASGTRYFFESDELFAENITAPLCPRFMAGGVWQIKPAWLSIIAGRETNAKRALDLWMEQSEQVAISDQLAASVERGARCERLQDWPSE